jgi:hypothetical protein
MLFVGFRLISLVILGSSSILTAENSVQSLCICPSAEHYPNSTWKRLPFCGYELGAECRHLQVMHWCTGPSAVPQIRKNDCTKYKLGMFCNTVTFDHRERGCRDFYSCKPENMDCGRNRSARPGFIYLNYGK